MPEQRTTDSPAAQDSFLKDDFLKSFAAARRVGTPLIAVTTSDPAATVQALSQGEARIPRWQWDCVGGMRPINQAAADAVSRGRPSQEDLAATVSTVEMLDVCKSLPGIDEVQGGDLGGSVVFMLNAQRFVCEQTVMQAVWNLRDPFKSTLRTLVMLGPGFSLPPELTNDVLLLEESLPGEAALGEILDSVCESAGMAALAPEERAKAVFAVRGLPAFAAEQAAAMSVLVDEAAGAATGLDLEELWARKRGMIGQTPGLKINLGGETFGDLGGLTQIKRFCEGLFNGRRKPTVIVRVDEIEKALAGAAGDMSGTSQDALGVLLREMEDNAWRGILAIGYPGTGKSAISKAMGNLGGVPTIEIDLGEMKGSLVGQSEQMVRAAMRVIKAVAGDGAFFVGTCNRVTDDAGRSLLPPELMRRFPYGKWFFDLPSAEDRDGIWDRYIDLYGLGEMTDVRPPDDGWTGAEIKTVCEIADRLGVSLVEASQYIVPFAVSNASLVERLRHEAQGNFLSASAPGPYQMPAHTQPTPAAPTGRRFAKN